MDHIKDRLVTAVRGVDEDSNIVEHTNKLLSEPTETAVAAVETSVAKTIAEVVRDLKDSHPEPVKDLDSIELLLQRVCVLHVVDDGPPTTRVRVVDITCCKGGCDLSGECRYEALSRTQFTQGVLPRMPWDAGVVDAGARSRYTRPVP